MPRKSAAESTARKDVVSASISGELILVAGPEVGGYRLSLELLRWLSSTCPKFAGRPVRIRIEALDGQKGAGN